VAYTSSAPPFRGPLLLGLERGPGARRIDRAVTSWSLRDQNRGERVAPLLLLARCISDWVV